MSKYKISVIVPIYNAENTLKRCLNSVINQTIGFKNIELILVDDKSTDNSKKIIEEYKNKYSNIKTIFSQKNNGNPGYVRSLGIDIATAPYLMFIDTDDTYEENICKILYENIKSNNVSLVQCNHKIIFNESGEVLLNSKEKNLPNYPFNPDEFTDSYIQAYFWTKIYRTENAKNKNIYLYKTFTPEDLIFNLEYLCYSNSKILVLNNYFGYNYYVYETSLSKNPNKNIERDCYSLIEISNLLTKFKPNNYEIHYKVYNLMLNIILTNLVKVSYMEESEFNHIINLDYESESYLPIKINMEEKWMSILNNLIMGKHYKLTRYYCKIMNFLLQSNYLKKMYRKKIN